MLVLQQVKPAEAIDPNEVHGNSTTKKEVKTEAKKSSERREEALKILKALLMLGGYMLLGGLSYTALEADQNWTATDACYFTMATMSTVGYGDISPSTPESRGFTIFMIFFGIVFVFAEVANAISFITTPITRKGRYFLEWLLPQEGVDGADGPVPHVPLPHAPEAAMVGAW